MSVHHLDVSIRELNIGKPLEFDVLDASGIVLLRRGLVLSRDVVDGWTRRGYARVLLRQHDEIESDDRLADAEAKLLSRPYDPQLLVELNQSFARAKRAVDEIISQLAMREEADISMLSAISQTYLDALQIDIGVVLYNAASQKVATGEADNNVLSTRCIQMAVLGAVTAATLGLSRDDCQAVALAGLLHDMSLFQETLAMIEHEHTTPEERREVYFRHSLRSAELFSRCHGVSDLVRIVITQVHEQVDGHGFPRGLPGHRLNILSRVLGIVDAYLTLIEPNQQQPAYVPSDAIAYLVSHTNNGAFDRDCMKAFLTALSIYGVGSKVLLDDSRTATILRSSRSDPLRPIVRIDDGSETIIDLRRSKLNVARPTLEAEFPHRRRLPKAQMQAVLWKPLF